MPRVSASCLIVLIALPAALAAEESPRDDEFAVFVQPLLVKHCGECHGAEKPKRQLRLDTIAPDFADAAARKRWLLMAKRLAAGTMPPKDKPRPAAEEVQRLTAWIHAQADAAEKAQRAEQGRAVMRRLNRVEYENTIRDLLGIDIDLQDTLPLDTSAHGFDNVGEALHTSSFLMERYLEAAERSLELAIANRPQPPLAKQRLKCEEQHPVTSTTEKVYRHDEGALVLFSSSDWNAITFWKFYPPDRGRYRYRISANAVQSGDQPVTFRIDAGPMLMGTRNHLVSYYDVKPGEPQVIEFFEEQDAKCTIRLTPYGLATAHVVNKIGADAYEGPGLAVQWVDVEGPLYDAWPPASHRRIFGDLPQEKVPLDGDRERLEVVTLLPADDAERILRNFAKRAFRRPVADDDLRPILELTKSALEEGRSFEQSVRVGLLGVLMSPQFLFLQEPPGKLDDYALATRLSFFLWSTMPDERLLQLANEKQLAEPAVLRDEVERMLADPKSREFTENFLGQWLSLRDIDFTEPDPRLYPEFDDMLKASMVRETHEFFGEVLREDLSVANFVSCDFTFLNERLAKHYGIAGVPRGWEMKKVSLPADSHRGGLLTMASVLKVTANGTTTSPVLRGAWVLDRILGTPPEPPPEGVTAIEPDIRGATTIREQLAKHRQIETCAACHKHIDPAGFALESFDVIGGYRERYRSVGSGDPVTIDGRSMPYANGPAVDPSDTLADGRRFANVDELKELLASDKDQLTRALACKLLTYATGHAPEAADEPQIEAIVERVRVCDHGLRSLVHEIVQSPLFSNK